MSYKYKVTGGQQGSAVSVVTSGGQLFVAADGHPNYNRIVNAVTTDADESEVVELFDTGAAVEKRFNAVSDRVQIRGGQIEFDGKRINNAVTAHIIRSLDEGNDNFAPFVHFLVRVEANPSLHSKENLFRWLSAENFSITETGMIIGYKGLTSDYTSIHSGPAVVNGAEFNGHVPNIIGSVIEMERTKVTLNPAQGCARGLHVGTEAYARGFGSTVVEVLVDPADVVSVPTDCSDQKMRVCRYTVAKVSQQKILEAVVFDYDDVDDDVCDNCGSPDGYCECYF